MREIFFIALMLTSQLFAQMEEGLYYCTDIYICDVESHKVISEKKMNSDQYIMVEQNGVRMYSTGHLGVYNAWIYIGDFSNYETYVLTNGNKICIAPEINGVYYFYEDEYDNLEYKKLIQFRNLTRITKTKWNKYGNHVMEIN
tara:strand:+ start:1207 stop:1635 length:429 start_codon:yes stop_codon:yes gene_type:complete